MTDKQIIIDDVDVAKCKYYNNGWCLLSESCDQIKYRSCGDMTLFDCHYRNWQRKEQECEELKKELDFQKNMYECARADEEDKFEEIIELKQTLEEVKEIADETLWNYPTLDDVRVYQNLEKISRITEDFVDEEGEDD